MTGTNPSSYKTDVRLLKLSVKREFIVNRKGDGGIRDSTRKLKAARLSQVWVKTFSAFTQRLQKFEKSEYTIIFEKGRRTCLTMCQLGARISL